MMCIEEADQKGFMNGSHFLPFISRDPLAANFVVTAAKSPNHPPALMIAWLCTSMMLSPTFTSLNSTIGTIKCNAGW